MDAAEQVIDTVLAIFREEGERDYGGEHLSQTAHALQCGWLAEKAGASPALITAALLHDIGHLINPDDRVARRRGEDGFHEVVGCDYLSRWFGADVTEPIMWHVAAKRYLTAAEPDYFGTLSEGSVRSLELQGGPFYAGAGGAVHRTSLRQGRRDGAALGRRREDPASRNAAAGAFPPASGSLPEASVTARYAIYFSPAPDSRSPRWELAGWGATIRPSARTASRRSMVSRSPASPR